MCPIARARVALFSGGGLAGSYPPRGAAAPEAKLVRGFGADRADMSSEKAAETDATTRANTTRDVGLNTASASFSSHEISSTGISSYVLRNANRKRKARQGRAKKARSSRRPVDDARSRAGTWKIDERNVAKGIDETSGTSVGVRDRNVDDGGGVRVGYRDQLLGIREGHRRGGSVAEEDLRARLEPAAADRHGGPAPGRSERRVDRADQRGRHSEGGIRRGVYRRSRRRDRRDIRRRNRRQRPRRSHCRRRCRRIRRRECRSIRRRVCGRPVNVDRAVYDQ